MRSSVGSGGASSLILGTLPSIHSNNINYTTYSIPKRISHQVLQQNHRTSRAEISTVSLPLIASNNANDFDENENCNTFIKKNCKVRRETIDEKKNDSEDDDEEE